jgi:hypothetical protein
MLASAVSFEPRARLFRLLAPLCLAASASALTVAACSVPDFEFPEPPAMVGAGGEVSPPSTVPHCRNGELDSDSGESDFDCGRGCGPCGAGKHCTDVADCEAGLLCHEGACLGPGCMNDAVDGSETDVDCGGGSCVPCITGKSCVVGGDCDSGVCGEAKCLAPACDDGVENGK